MILLFIGNFGNLYLKIYVLYGDPNIASKQSGFVRVKFYLLGQDGQLN